MGGAEQLRPAQSTLRGMDARPPSASAEFLQVSDVILEQTCCRCNNAGAAHTIFGLCIAAIKDLVAPSVPRSGEEELGARGRRRKSAAAEVFVEVDDLGGLLKAEQNVEVGAFAAVEWDRFLDVVGDTGAFLGALENNTDRERPLTDDRLIGSGYRDEIREVHDVSLRGRTAFPDNDRVKCDLQVAAAVLAFEVGLAQDPVESDVVGATLLGGSEDGSVGEGPQHDRTWTSLGLLRRGRRQPTTTRQSENAEERCPLGRPQAAHRVLCVPSQNGLPPVALHPQSQTSSVASAVNGTGVNPVP